MIPHESREVQRKPWFQEQTGGVGRAEGGRDRGLGHRETRARVEISSRCVWKRVPAKPGYPRRSLANVS